jgi:hypothetical protein
MNALEAAIELLKDARRALSAEDLARLAVEKKLVARAAAKALDKQLAAEADADDGRVSRSDGGYTLRKSKAAAKKAPPAKGKAAEKAKPVAKGKAPPAKGKAAEKAKPEPRPEPKTEAKPARGRSRRGTEASSQESLALPVEPTPPESMAGFAPAPGAIEPAPMDDNELADVDEDALHERIAVEAAEVAETVAAAGEASAEMAEPAAEMSDEEKALVDLYSEDLSGRPAQVHGEYQDQRTADEDRPMLPEINAREERQKKWEARRDERRRRRDEDRQRRQDRRGDRPADRPAEARPEARGDRPQPAQGGRTAERQGQGDRPERAPRPVEARPQPAPAPVAVEVVASADEPATNGHHVAHRVGNSLGDAAWAVFSQLRSTQPMPVRQLAQMMRKRGLIESEPEQVWPHLKAALLGDERSYRTLGLRPRIVYRGRDLFGVGPVAQSATAGAEAGLATALTQLAVATHKVLKERIARASQGGFERLVHAYLVAVGYQDIDWIKRVPGISYGTALPPDGGSQILVSARSGESPVDRRGVGELRVGVEAKGFLSGLLIAARELSEEAERELERPGRSIAVLAGDAFVGALLGSGVGVVTAAAPVRYVDDQLLDELLAG